MMNDTLKTLLRDITRRAGFDIRRPPTDYSRACVSLASSARPARGSALLAYILEPFLRSAGEPVSTAHTHHGESLLMAQTLLDLGFDVDVIDYHNDEFRPRKSYDVFISARTRFEHLARQLRPSCVKIAHLDTAHFVFNNHAAYARALALQQRRGATCTSIRVIEENNAIECADYAALLGGDFMAQTYAFAGKPSYRLPIPTVTTYPFPHDKDYDECRRRFLWFGSSGLVHKGLDLVLEAFAQLPQYELLVCGPIADDAVFQSIYRRELYELPNIRTLGWVDVTDRRFIDVTRQCVALVFPSCAESQSASSITCMQAGLIPILSREAGIDAQDFGMLLPQATIEEIKLAVTALAQRDPADLERMSRAAWNHARTTHTKERYTAEYRRMLTDILRIDPR